MAAPTTFGATIVNKKPNEDDATTRLQPACTPAASQYSLDLTEEHHLVPPVSPFHTHPPASNEVVSKSTDSKKYLDISVAEKGHSIDELTPVSTKANDPFSSSISVNANQECPMWPSKQTLKDANMAEKRKKRSARSCACGGPRERWAGIPKKQKLIISLIIALILIAAMIGLGVGVSKAVNGSYYTPGGSKST